MRIICSVFTYLFLANYGWGIGRIDICSPPSVKRVFLRLGESGILTGLNVTRGNLANVSYLETCQIDIVTCPSCVVSIRFKLLSLSCFCGVGFNLFLHNPCRCDFVWISEPPYRDSSGVSFCKMFPVPGTLERDLGYKSKTRMVRIWLFYRESRPHAFTLDFKSERNRQIFLGASGHPPDLNLSSGSISSPFFPAAYPLDMVAEYVLTCLKASYSSVEVSPENDENCRVRLAFTDFLLGSASIVEFYDGNRRLGAVSGAAFRPPVIMSQTNSLMIRFRSLGHSSTGFKAHFSFLSQSILKNTVKANTDCGGHVDNFGGTITMLNMVESQVRLFDCIWLIKPVSNFYNVETHLYLKVTAFLGFGALGELVFASVIDEAAELEIRRGLTSESPLLKELRHSAPKNFHELVVPPRSGFYVSLRAVFGPGSHFAVSYASFSQNKCFVSPGFLCKNFRCIAETLTCDGANHCGDNSDESADCYQEWRSGSELDGRRRDVIDMPNYYFPKIDEFSVVKTASAVLLVVVVVMLFLMFSVTAAFYRIGTKAQRQRELEEDMQSISDVRDCLSDEVSVEDVVIDDPPSYEPPPNYEEVVKAPATNESSADDHYNYI